MLSYKKILFAVFLLLLLSFQTLQAETITVSNQTAGPGDNVYVTISLDTPDSVQGAAFTVSYDTDYLTLTAVTSPFFKTFEQQWNEMTSPPDPLPPLQVIIDGVTYDRPFVFNAVPGGIMMAAAKVEAGGNENRLLILEFALASDIPDGTFPVSVSTSFINNSGAGYSADGQGVPILFPSALTTVVNGRITVGNAPFIDTDNDGIDDAWEMEHFNNLTTASATSDYDKDGYTDLQEFLNDGLKDPLGNDYDPKIKNAGGGAGYNPYIGNSNFWILMMPALLNITHQ